MTAATALHVDGAESDRAEARVRELGRALGIPAILRLGWSASSVEFSPGDAGRVRWFSAAPVGQALNRVMAVDRVVDRVAGGTIRWSDAERALSRATSLPPAGIAVFAAACAVGACGLAVVFGVEHPLTLVIIAVASILGALARRGLGRLGADNFWQAGAAGLIAGLAGVVSGALGTSTPLGLAAVCPCMILVPGPHLLKGALDLGTLRIPLGIARLSYATLTLISIGTGLLVGLWIGGGHLEPDPTGHVVPVWIDAPTAAVVAVCYGVFYSAPWRILAWPFVVGGLAHALRWLILEVGHAESWVGAGVACLFVGAVLVPICARFRIPFAAVGFASVVSLMPGVLVFRALGGLAQLQTASGSTAGRLLLDTTNNVNGAALTILAMAIGFLIPVAVWSKLLPRAGS